MKLLKSAALTLVCGAAMFAACKKDSDNPVTTPKTVKDYLTEGKWQLESQITTEVVNGVSTSHNEYDSLQACEKDNFMTFGANGKVYSDEGAMKCSSSNPQVDSTTTWALLSDTKMAVTDGGYTDTLDVAATATSFQFTIKETDSAYSYTSVMKYKNIK
jgi:hypothetical protein